MILILPYGYALSHTGRLLAVARELRACGFNPVFAGRGQHLRFVHRDGFTVHPLDEIPYEVLFSRIRKRRLRFITAQELSRLIEADMALFRHFKPRLVITDGRISSRFSTHLYGVPHVAVVNVSSSKLRKIPYCPFPFVEKLPHSLRGGVFSINRRLEMKIFDLVCNAFTLVARRFRVTLPITATTCLEGNDMTLFADIPIYMPATQPIPATHHYVGPLIPQLDIPDPPWWPEIPKRKRDGWKILYFTIGTTGTKALFEALAECVFNKKWLVMATTGGLVPLPKRRSAFFTTEFINGDRAMEVADLCICHGGNGTVYQALCHETPILGIPTLPDQGYNMRRVEELQCGQALSHSPSALRHLTAIVDRWMGKDLGTIARQVRSARNAAPKLACDLIQKRFSP